MKPVAVTMIDNSTPKKRSPRSKPEPNDKLTAAPKPASKPVTKAASKSRPKSPPIPEEPIILDPWDQQPKENDEPYEAWIEYRNMGSSRSHRAVAQKLGKSRSLISRWADDWNWSERLTAWNRVERARLDAERIDKQRDVLDAEFNDAQDLLKRYHEMMKAATGIHKTPQIVEMPDKSKVKIIEVDIAGLREMARLRKDIRDLARGAVGLPAQITQTQVTGSDGGPMDVSHTVKVTADTMATLRKQMDEYERGKRDVPQRSDPTKNPQ